MALSDLRRIRVSIKTYDEYKIDKNIMVYLFKIGSIYQGEHLFKIFFLYGTHQVHLKLQC